MIPRELRKVLEATGYLDGGRPAPGVLVDDDARGSRRSHRFAPDALWRGPHRSRFISNMNSRLRRQRKLLRGDEKFGTEALLRFSG